jgi:hypothetical protein
VAAFAATLIVLVGLFATGNTFLRHFYAARAEPVPAVTQVPPSSSDAASTAGPGPDGSGRDGPGLDGPGLDGPGLAKRSGGPAVQPLPSAPQDPSPGDSDGRSASPVAADSAGSTAAGAESAAGGAAGEAGSAAKGATAVTGAVPPTGLAPGAVATTGLAPGTVATAGLAPGAAGQGGAQKPSSTDAPPGPAASAPSETPAALRPAPANSAPASPLPWIASDDASAGQARTTPNATAQTHATPNAGSKWVVREGDTVYKVCVVTYGSCEERRLRALLADNPKLGRDATIRPGDILVLRKRGDRSAN